MMTRCYLACEETEEKRFPAWYFSVDDQGSCKCCRAFDEYDRDNVRQGFFMANDCEVGYGRISSAQVSGDGARAVRHCEQACPTTPYFSVNVVSGVCHCCTE